MSVIVADVWDNADKLIGQHLQLALVEVENRVDKLKADLTIVALGGLVMYGGVLAALAAAVLALSTVLVPWAAALIVAAVAMLVGYLMLQRKPDLSLEPGQSKTAQSVSRTAHSLKEAVK